MQTTSSRHRLMSALVLVTVAVGLSACSTETSSAPSTSASSETRVVQTARGEVTVPAEPVRVVSLQSWTTESLIDLGVTPVAVEDPGEQYVPARYLDVWKATEKVTSGGEIDYEKIAALQPDLIVGVSIPMLDDAYDKLSAIAPTALATWDNTVPWTSYPEKTAEFVNRGDELAVLKTRYDERVAEVKEKYSEQLASIHWDIVQGGFDAGNYWIYSQEASPAGQVLTALGAQFASATAAVKAADTKSSVSYEQADLLADADAIIYYENNDGTPANNIDQLFALPGWKGLKAVTAGGVVGTPDFLAGSYSDFLGLLDDIEARLAQTA